MRVAVLRRMGPSFVRWILRASLVGAQVAVLAACGGDHGTAPLPNSDGGNNASGDAGPFCPMTLDAYCAEPGANCIRDWQSAVKQAVTDACTTGFATTWHCPPFDGLGASGADTGTEMYFDGSSGALVAVVASSANTGTSTCLGGPESFGPADLYSLSHCSAAVSICPAPDAGGNDGP